MILWLLASLALGQDNLPEMWVQLHEGRLVHLVEGEPKDAIEIFEALLSGLSNEHPLYGELMFSLGCAQYDAHRLADSKRSLLLATKSVHAPTEAQSFLMEVSAQEHTVKSLPYVGTPWVSLEAENGRSTLYKANIELETVNKIEIDIRLDAPGDVTVTFEGWRGKQWEESKTYDSGIHTLFFNPKLLLIDEKPIAIRSIEVGVEQRNILMVSTLSLE